MAGVRPGWRIAVRALGVGPALLSAVAAAGGVTAAAASGAASVATNRGCYLVGQSVHVSGAGFAPKREFDVAIDGVDFGQSTTDSSGGFSVSLIPGGLAAGVVQVADQLDASDGTAAADASFTVTRPTGARFLAGSGNPGTLVSRFQVWGFGRDGIARRAYLHYVSPSGTVPRTVSLGTTGGQCGYLLSSRRRVFPFTPSAGNWTLQVDAHPGYRARPAGPVARIGVIVG